MFKELRNFFFSNSAEGNIVIIICAFGLLRAIIALITDWHAWGEDSTLQYRNLILGLIFGIVLILEFQQWDKEWIRVVFGLAFIMLLQIRRMFFS